LRYVCRTTETDRGTAGSRGGLPCDRSVTWE
jgi:hypothetical protein